MTALTSISPIDETLIAEHAIADERQIADILQQATDAQRAWAQRTHDERAFVLRAIAAALREDVAQLSEMITAEMGKTIVEARAEIEKSAWVCEYYAQEAARQLAEEPIDTGGMTAVGYHPLGVVLAIMPWNYPVWQVMRAAAPTLAAGNTVVLKHASNVTGSALLLAETVRRASGSAGLLQLAGDSTPAVLRR